MAENHIPFAIPSEQKEGNDRLDFIDEDEATTAIQHLCEAARGVALVLQSLADRDGETGSPVLGGLATVLKIAVDGVDAGYFRSAGDLASTIDPELLSGLLARQIKRLAKERGK